MTVNYITPYLPKDALAEAKAWNAQNKPVFVKAIAQNGAGQCPNCAGLGVIYLDLAGRGPYQQVPSSKDPITWFDGDGAFGKGWYIIEQTVPYACPECAKAKAVGVGR